MARATFTAVRQKGKTRSLKTVVKSYSYRYEVGSNAGPDGHPLVEQGSAIIETRYRGRAASWTVKPTMMSEVGYVVNARYVAPDAENPMVYPEGAVPRAPRPVDPARPAAAPATPGPAPTEGTKPAAPAGATPAPPAAPAPAAQRIIAHGRKFIRATS